MTYSSGVPVFLLNLENREFAEGKGPLPLGFQVGGKVLASTVMRILLIAGTLLTVAGVGVYFYKISEHTRLIDSVRTITASVTGCAGPGQFQNIRFHYNVGNKQYDESAYWRKSEFLGPGGLIRACESGTNTIQLQYLEDDPGRWAIAPLSPLKREEKEFQINPAFLIAGPFALLGAGLYWLVMKNLANAFARRKRLAAEGVLLHAELIEAREEDGESAYIIRCEYQFTTPGGLTLRNKNFGTRRDLKKKDFPPAGTPMVVLYVNDNLYEAL